MPIKWIGGILVILACGGCGFSMAAGCRREERMLGSLLHVLEFMESELEYRLTPLPQLCRDAAGQTGGSLARVLEALAGELEGQISPDAGCCMAAALGQVQELPWSVRGILGDFGRSLGRFDLPGQMRELEAIRSQCQRKLEALRAGQTQRIRSYQTLGICAGIALAILLM